MNSLVKYSDATSAATPLIGRPPPVEGGRPSSADAPEVGRGEIRLADELGALTREHDSAGVQNVRAVRERDRACSGLLDEKDRRAFGLQLGKRLEDEVDHHRREA